MAVKPKLPEGKGAMSAGQMKGKGQADKFAEVMEVVPTGIDNIQSLHDDIGEKSGFDGNTANYIVKKGTPYGEAAKLNFLPPGMDISNQEMKDIRNMEFKTLVDTSFPGDGWEPHPRDIKE